MKPTHYDPLGLGPSPPRHRAIDVMYVRRRYDLVSIIGQHMQTDEQTLYKNGLTRSFITCSILNQPWDLVVRCYVLGRVDYITSLERLENWQLVLRPFLESNIFFNRFEQCLWTPPRFQGTVSDYFFWILGLRSRAAQKQSSHKSHTGGRPAGGTAGGRWGTHQQPSPPAAPAG